MNINTTVTFCEKEMCELAEHEARAQLPHLKDTEASVLITGVQAGPGGALENFEAVVTFSDTSTTKGK